MVTKLNTVAVFMICILMALAPCNQSVRAENLLSSGKFVTGNPCDTTLRTAEIFQKDNRIFIRRSGDFSTKNEPDLKGLLHKQNRPEIQDEYTALGNLKNLKGAKVSEIPEDTYAPVTVWFQKFNVGFEIPKLDRLEIVPLVDSSTR